jgi:hypothetical protein
MCSVNNEAESFESAAVAAAREQMVTACNFVSVSLVGLVEGHAADVRSAGCREHVMLLCQIQREPQASHRPSATSQWVSQ